MRGGSSSAWFCHPNSGFDARRKVVQGGFAGKAPCAEAKERAFRSLPDQILARLGGRKFPPVSRSAAAGGPNFRRSTPLSRGPDSSRRGLQLGENGIAHLGGGDGLRRAARDIGGAKPLGQHARNCRIEPVGDAAKIEGIA